MANNFIRMPREHFVQTARNHRNMYIYIACGRKYFIEASILYQKMNRKCRIKFIHLRFGFRKKWKLKKSERTNSFE